ncbi:hypothetical protein OH407_23620, partial [Salmonella enterica]|uniref:hypothetical protein n=1 Tax=Salmonella enterica TaxID=28901 RepID=UPI0022B6667C
MNTKKALGAVLFSAVFAASISPVSAIYDPNNQVKPKPGEVVILSSPAAATEHHLVINGKPLQNAEANV